MKVFFGLVLAAVCIGACSNLPIASTGYGQTDVSDAAASCIATGYPTARRYATRAPTKHS